MPVFPLDQIQEKIQNGIPLRWPLGTSTGHAYRLLRILEMARVNHESQKTPLNVIWSTENEDELDALFNNLVALGSQKEFSQIEILKWTPWEHSPYAPVSPSVSALENRMETLAKLSVLHHRPRIIVTSCLGLAQPTLPKKLFDQNILELKAGELFEREQLTLLIRSMGYIKSEVVEEAGQFSFRGDILDIFPLHTLHPYRIDWFDIEIESIRTYDPKNQRTIAPLPSTESIRLFPITEVLFNFKNLNEDSEKIKLFADHYDISRKVRDPIMQNLRAGFLPENVQTWIPLLHQKPGIILDYIQGPFILATTNATASSAAITKSRELFIADHDRYKDEPRICPTPDMLFSEDTRALDALSKATWRLDTLATDDRDEFLPEAAMDRKEIAPAKIRRLRSEGFKVMIGSRTRTNRDRIQYLMESDQDILAADVSDSIQIESQKIIVLHENDFLGKTRVHAAKNTDKIKDFSADEILELRTLADIRIGDTVVHSTHGVGKYIGLVHLKNAGANAEYLLIEYTAGDKLYLPVYRLNSIHKYVGAGTHPNLDRLGSGGFEKAKQKARDEVRKLAINLIEVYAKRKLITGPKFVSRNEDYEKFAGDFEFTETEGQQQAIDEALDELESGGLMDRLVCGDVGFGKTEVAMRAAFQAVQSGYQVALLVPTTLLAFQHENNFKHRFRNFPVRIESVSRFKSRGHQKKVLQDTKDGKVDILIGTHRLLSKDVEWARLGLMIVDEEHRFGVEHKEKIRSIQTGTHTLTLTATPIPRTLHMAFSGLKNITIMKTPPSNRQPIKTFVSAHSDELVKSAIQQEVDRGGQVFYLFNRVATIQAKAKELQEMMPNIKILVAHGQMNETEVEEKMVDFYQGNAQVLLCTTIIESGIDIPRAGTIIIHRADLLGLAQLYQIRGRVGRSHRKAFAYMLVSDTGNLTDEAKQRLEVIQRFVELGSGFQIASYDLELRGGGNLLGAEQSGHIAAVGLDLFMELLHEAVSEMQGNPGRLDDMMWEPEIQLPFRCDIDASIVPDSQLRLSLYRRLSGASTLEKIDHFRQEFEDRFGSLPESTENLFWLMKMKILLKKTGIETLVVAATASTLTAKKQTLVEPDEVMKAISGPKGVRDPRLKLTPDSKLTFHHHLSNARDTFYELEMLLKRLAPKAFENAVTR